MLLVLILGAGSCNGPCALRVAPPVGAPAAGAHDSAPAPARAALTIEQLELEQAITSSAVQALATRVTTLGVEWDGVVREYERAATAYQAAQRALHEAQKSYRATNDRFQEAAHVASRAAQEWRLAQALIVVAALADAGRLDQARAGHDLTLNKLSCAEGMSTRAFRALLDPLGIKLVDKDICHIVPLSLGGANHPANYMPCAASFNRSLGNTWNRDICRWFGEARCRQAIAVSRTCGTYRGFGI